MSSISGKTMDSSQGRRKGKHAAQAAALLLIGAGLLVLGLVGVFLMPELGKLTGAGPLSDPYSSTPVEMEYPAPELELTDLEGNEVSLADYLGKVVLVNNWATWCPPCKEEMPALQAYYDTHQEQGFTIIAIEAGETVPEVKAFVEEYRLTFPVWPDRGQKSLLAFRNMNLPNSYVIDREGIIRLTWTGPISEKMLENTVTPLLEE
jgi:peroxiredoxin